MSIMRRGLALVLALCLLATAGCSLTNQYGDFFRFPLSDEPQQLDPQIATDNASVEVLHALMDGLTRLGENGEVLPAVAESWRSEKAHTVWVFTLRNSCWNDGTPLTASDFVYAWNRAVDPATGSPLRDRFDNIRSAVATDEHTLTVTLNTADPDFDRAVADTPFFPCNETFFLATAGRYGMDKGYIPSNGAFAVTAWEHHSYLIIRKNSQYYAADRITPDAIRFIISDVGDKVTALKEGALDATELSAAEAQTAAAAGLPVLSMNDSLQAIWFNTETPALSSSSVRRALRDTIEWNLLKDTLAVHGAAAGQVDFVPPDATADNGRYRETVGTVGWTAAEDAAAGLRQAELPTLTVLCADDTESITLARLVLQSWQKNADLYFSLKSLSKTELTAHLAIGNYEIAIAPAAGCSGDAAAMLAAYNGDRAENLSRLQDADYATAVTAADSPAALKACEQLLHKLCPCVPLWYEARYYGTGKDVTGLTIHPFSGQPYGYIYDFSQADK